MKELQNTLTFYFSVIRLWWPWLSCKVKFKVTQRNSSTLRTHLANLVSITFTVQEIWPLMFFTSMKLRTLNGQSQRPSGATLQQNIDTCINSMDWSLYTCNMESITWVNFSPHLSTLFFAKMSIFSPNTRFTPPVTLTFTLRV